MADNRNHAIASAFFAQAACRIQNPMNRPKRQAAEAMRRPQCRRFLIRAADL